MKQNVTAVIGANFGDEGKGLAVDYFCSTGEGALVIRHNGGAQAGHTVEYNGRRFVFHQLSSGSFRKADTFLARTFLPDLYKLEEEAALFREISGFVPVIYADTSACVTVIDDVIINMALETSRRKSRHGSCGMGINEAVLRSSAGFRLTVGEVLEMDAKELADRLSRIRRMYSAPRFRELGLDGIGEYSELISDESILAGAAQGMLRGISMITPAKSLRDIAQGRKTIVFEGAQGLLLDSENLRYAPHLTSSRTGLHNPLMLCRESGIVLDRAVYIMRSYITKHGAGPLSHECDPALLGNIGCDCTNIDNPWQGSIRYARYDSPKELSGNIMNDVSDWKGEVGLFVTHLNETEGMLRFSDCEISARELLSHPSFGGRFSRLWCSGSHYAEDTEMIN